MCVCVCVCVWGGNNMNKSPCVDWKVKLIKGPSSLCPLKSQVSLSSYHSLLKKYY